MTAHPPPLIGSWRYRRRTMVACLGFFMAVIAYSLWQRLDTEVAKTAVEAASYGIVAIVGTYVFGATWDDREARKILGPRASGAGLQQQQGGNDGAQ